MMSSDGPLRSLFDKLLAHNISFALELLTGSIRQ